MKKVFAIVMLGLLVLSLAPAAFARSSDDGDEERVREEVRVKDGEVERRYEARTADGSEIRIRERLEAKDLDAEERRELLRERVEKLSEERQELRVRAEERAAELRAKAREEWKDYDEAKQRYVEAREEYRSRAREVQEVRQRFRECEDDGTDACVEVRERVKVQAKPFLGNSAEVILEALHRTAARIVENEDLDPETKEELLARLEARIAEIEDAKAAVEALGDDATAQDIREAAAEIRARWKESEGELKRGAGMVVNAKLGNIVVQTEQLSERLHRARDRLAERGADVSALDDYLATFDEKLAMALAEWEEAKELFSAARDAEDVNAAVREAQSHVEAAKELLKEARDELRMIVNEIKAENAGELPDDDADDSDGNETDDDAGENETAPVAPPEMPEDELEAEGSNSGDDTVVGIQQN